MKILSRFGLILVALAAVSACSIQLPKVPSGSLILDIEAQVLCLNNAASCRSLSLIATNAKRNELLRHWQGDPWDWSRLQTPSDLANLLLSPPYGSYRVEQLSDSQYQLSISPVTLDAWTILNDEYKLRYLERN
ncbi:hypothetical protein [Motiliproteus coralliicola]|uniref:hypothetical protein n=1 Tax=Motiliproteus coralliicola TaxID=2283196 RepID=UPI000E09DA17|nr:hypothetical protein [Motiliproteus coralliicola]